MVQLIVKPTERCNSNCAYCYVTRGNPSSTSMSRTLFETLFARIDEFLSNSTDESVEILWHGGEPLLLGAEFFKSVLSCQNDLCKDTGSRIRHSVQTNLTCFSEAFADIFRQMGISVVGTSYDPEPHMRGPGTEIDSSRYNAMFFNGLSLLEKHGFGWALIYVVTRKSLTRAVDTFFYLTNLSLTGMVNINPALIFNDELKDLSISPVEYADFLGSVFPHWWKHRDRYPNVQPFRGITEAIIENRNSPESMKFGVCDSSYHSLEVSPEGEIFQSGRVSELTAKCYGSIKNSPLEEVLGKNRHDQIEEKLKKLRSGECEECRMKILCMGSSETEKYLEHDCLIRKDEWCEARIRFIEKYFEPITGVIFK